MFSVTVAFNSTHTTFSLVCNTQHELCAAHPLLLHISVPGEGDCIDQQFLLDHAHSYTLPDHPEIYLY